MCNFTAFWRLRQINLKFNFKAILGLIERQKNNSNKASTMTQPGKAFTAKVVSLSSIPMSMWWEKRRDSWKLISDFHTCVTCTHAHTNITKGAVTVHIILLPTVLLSYIAIVLEIPLCLSSLSCFPSADCVVLQ